MTFGTGAKVVESAGIVRVKDNDPTGNWSVTVLNLSWLMDMHIVSCWITATHLLIAFILETLTAN